MDSLLSSHAIEVDVKNPAEIGQVFDAISYSKGFFFQEIKIIPLNWNLIIIKWIGACVIRMLVNYLGSESFVAGLRVYLKRVILFFDFKKINK